MLTVAAILQATRQMTSFGETGTRRSPDGHASREGCPRATDGCGRRHPPGGGGDRIPARLWDDAMKVFVHAPDPG